MLDAIDDRLGLKALQYPVPEHANKLAYSLGGLTLIAFILMVATGVFLTHFYNPDPAEAHGSVRDIVTGVTFGEFVRAFHYWGAMAMIVLLGLHLLRVFASASCKRPREANWLFGVVLARITAALFFTGTVLKWDQEAIEALGHTIEISRLLGRFGFWFSPTFGGISLLGRLYVIHIAVLPFLFILVVAVHLMLVKRHGMAPSPFRRAPEPEPTHPFSSHLAELGSLALVLIGVLTVLVRSYLELEGHSVLVADTGGRVLESASRSNPDLVVLDFGLPPGEGGGPPALHTPHLGSNWWM